MSDTPQPTSGALSAKLIRACTKHRNCALDCPRRKVEDLGQVARFGPQPTLPNPSVDLLSRISHLFRKE